VSSVQKKLNSMLRSQVVSKFFAQPCLQLFFCSGQRQSVRQKQDVLETLQASIMRGYLKKSASAIERTVLYTWQNISNGYCCIFAFFKTNFLTYSNDVSIIHPIMLWTIFYFYALYSQGLSSFFLLRCMLLMSVVLHKFNKFLYHY
jgi:hypothetical protein